MIRCTRSAHGCCSEPGGQAPVWHVAPLHAEPSSLLPVELHMISGSITQIISCLLFHKGVLWEIAQAHPIRQCYKSVVPFKKPWAVDNLRISGMNLGAILSIDNVRTILSVFASVFYGRPGEMSSVLLPWVSCLFSIRKKNNYWPYLNGGLLATCCDGFG